MDIKPGRIVNIKDDSISKDPDTQIQGYVNQIIMTENKKLYNCTIHFEQQQQSKFEYNKNYEAKQIIIVHPDCSDVLFRSIREGNNNNGNSNHGWNNNDNNSKMN